jgi:phosphatidylserine/phosphatidylglycerophosphate/cardiolipin synthase-like enzyme
VQLLRTYPVRRPPYPFAPDGERSVARGIGKALRRARRLVYIEDQYLWSEEVAAGFCHALEHEGDLRLVAVLPRFPDQDGRMSTAPNLIGRYHALRSLIQAGGERVAIYGLEAHDGTPVYVHAKVCVIDDEWAAVGSGNLNRRSWTHDSELSCAVVDPPETRRAVRPYAQSLRLDLAREHLDRPGGDDEDLEDPDSFFTSFASAAAHLDAWHATGRQGRRPPGRLRVYPVPRLSAFARAWSTPLYRAIYDPDGRPRSLRREGRF